MLLAALDGLVRVLAAAGAIALIVRLLRALGQTMLRTAEIAAAAGSAEVSARRGDLTRLQEGRASERAARRGQRRAALMSILWLTWIVVPLMVGAVPEAWVLAAPLWALKGG